MALVSSVLGTELANLTPTDTESVAIDTFAAAWEAYFDGATVAGVPVTVGSYAAALTALRGGLVGVSADGAGPAKIQAAITSFWASVATLAPTMWAIAPPPTGATPPAGLGGIAAALTTVFASNASGDLSLVDAANAVAAAIHPTQLGGICVLPAPPTGLGPQPIL